MATEMQYDNHRHTSRKIGKTIIVVDFELELDLTNKKDLTKAISDLKNRKANKESKDSIKNIFLTEYCMQQSKNWDKDFEEFWNMSNQPISKIVEFYHNVYNSNSKLLPIVQPTATDNSQKKSMPKIDFFDDPNVFADNSKSINERIRLAYNQGMPASELAKIMGVKTSRVSSVYYKLKNK